jgi:hypothetical protein
MQRSGHAALVGVLGILAALSGGCGGSGAPTSGPELFQHSSLLEVGDLYRNVVLDTHKPPTKAADFAKYENGFPGGYRLVKEGEIVVLWGAPLEESATGTVLAYEKTTPESGGFVLMQDTRTIKKMTAPEFQAAPKAPGTPDTKKK